MSDPVPSCGIPKCQNTDSLAYLRVVAQETGQVHLPTDRQRAFTGDVPVLVCPAHREFWLESILPQVLEQLGASAAQVSGRPLVREAARTLWIPMNAGPPPAMLCQMAGCANWQGIGMYLVEFADEAGHQHSIPNPPRTCPTHRPRILAELERLRPKMLLDLMAAAERYEAPLPLPETLKFRFLPLAFQMETKLGVGPEERVAQAAEILARVMAETPKRRSPA